MKEPVIVVCEGVFVFRTVEHAEQYIERLDGRTRTECNIAYDSEGLLLRVIVIFPNRGPAELGPPLVKVQSAEEEPTHQSDLRWVLINWLSEIDQRKPIGVPHDWLLKAPLDQLVTKALEYGTK